MKLKKVLSWLVTLAMVFALFPMDALASWEADTSETGTVEVDVTGGETAPVAGEGEQWALVDTKEVDDLTKPIYGTKLVDDETQPIYGTKEVDDLANPIYGTELVDDESKPIYGKKIVDGDPIYKDGVPTGEYEQVEVDDTDSPPIGYEKKEVETVTYNKITVPNLEDPQGFVQIEEEYIIGYEQKPVYEVEFTKGDWGANGSGSLNGSGTELEDITKYLESLGIYRSQYDTVEAYYDAIVKETGGQISKKQLKGKENGGDGTIYTVGKIEVGSEDDLEKPKYGTRMVDDPNQPIYGTKEVDDLANPIYGTELVDDESKPIYGKKIVDGDPIIKNGVPTGEYEQVEVDDTDSPPIGYEKKEVETVTYNKITVPDETVILDYEKVEITDEETIEAYEKMILEIYQRYVWVPDEEIVDGDGDDDGDGGYFEDTETGEELTPEDVQDIIDEITPLIPEPTPTPEPTPEPTPAPAAPVDPFDPFAPVDSDPTDVDDDDVVFDDTADDTADTADLVDINENQVPLASPPLATTTILDSEIPLASLPTTGGASKKAAPVAGIMAVLGGLMLGLKALKKDDEE